MDWFSMTLINPKPSKKSLMTPFSSFLNGLATVIRNPMDSLQKAKPHSFAFGAHVSIGLYSPSFDTMAL